jgi:ubiquinone/menaquinone biosynthesis C-methylase UbiE
VVGRGALDVQVVRGDATDMPVDDASFDVVVCFTMLPHLPSTEAQDVLLRETARALRPRGTMVGNDSRWGPLFALARVGDTMTLVDPTTWPERLRAAEFHDACCDRQRAEFRSRTPTMSGRLAAPACSPC